MSDTKISALTAVVTAAGTDELAVNQSGTSKKITVAQITGTHEATYGHHWFPGIISPTALDGTQKDDYNPTSLSTAGIILQDASSNTVITGLAGGAAGRAITLFNTSAASYITLADESGSSTAANRIRALDGGAQIPALGACQLFYDAVASRWRSMVMIQKGTGFSTQALGDTGTGGASGDVSRSDHKHVMPTVSAVAALLAPVVPTIVAVTAEFTGTGAPTATLPTGHTTNDILVLVIQQSNESNMTAPAGYVQVGPQTGIGTNATALATKIGVYWKRDGGSESAPTIPDTGDHTYGFMFAVRGCPTTGDPFHFGGNGWKFTSSTTGTSVTSSTYVDNVLVVDLWAGNVDNASAEGSSPTNADLSSVTEQFDDGTTDGTGGFLYMMTGIKAVAGPVAASTVTWANSSSDVTARLHFISSAKSSNGPEARGVETQIFIGSAADLDDLWVKPYGARRVMVQGIGGGGGGSSGRNAVTAAGGGGGGGGHCTPERWFRAEDLAATVAVHAGKGGAATANSDGASGNAGADTIFGKALSPVPLTAKAGLGGIAAASADGGDGGGGGGYPTFAAVATRLPRGVTYDGTGELGGKGGSGTTGPTGGSNAMWGGGGGESGADTDAAVAANGDSMYGGGGGAGGRAVQATLSVPGTGGGAAATSAARGTAGTDSTNLPYGGSGGAAGDATTGTGGAGGFPGGGGGGGGTASGSQAGGRGGHGCLIVTTWF